MLGRTIALASLACLACAQTRTDEASAAQITNPAQECAPYAYAPVTALQTAGGFPAIWEIANMSKATTDDLALYNALLPSIPNIKPKGTSAGNFTGVSYNGTADPDCWWTWKQCTTPKIAGLQADVTRCPEPNTWGFTLDDGPNCSHNAYYDYLRTQNQKATLFYIGSNVVDWPLEAQRGLDDGHEICAHTWSHRYMTALTNEQVFAELYYSKKAIKEVLGITVACWRPPYGDVDDRVRYIAQALGLATVIWADNTFDYLIATTNKTYIDGNYNAILAKQAAGDYNSVGTIVLSHELNNFTMQESEDFYPKIKAAFKAVAPIAVCNNNTNPYVETGYTYPNFAQWTAGTTSISLATATAVSTIPSMSIPLSTGVTGSVFYTNAYASGAATVGAASAGTTVAGNTAAPAAATSAVSTGKTSGSASATAHSGANSQRLSSIWSTGAVAGLVVAAGGVIGGGALVF
ncbi:glycoside hydrolase/deacetylase [Meredithblackwellia eburnea MCA 4105]